MKSKKVFLVLERKALKMLSYVNDELYKELYPRYLRKNWNKHSGGLSRRRKRLY